ncbi:beta-lactamase domain protein [Tolumonas auensis DSM 9187]|uniref:Beta-lactamase domain protein n=1 Tax=Tolumonas auensis (strain DSM 9187 / NBRC 110442 / TA 4) TaxID=595494 RepID=C4LFA1_TOLAT|nr:MBL fold metallo-hydrolase [Tolumonas auensis]ACQ93268.1 beta-lactamase domain protein [Tolumonas auensis DSM 9187]
MSCLFELTVICDNHAAEGLLPEHGLAFVLRADKNNILFDTGSGETLIHNATRLGIDLADITYLVLSHGHFDHTGGIAQVLHLNEHCPLIAHPFVLSERYSRHPDLPVRRISMPFSVQAALQQLSPIRLRCQSVSSMLSNNVGVTGKIPRTSLFEDTGGPFYIDEAGQFNDAIPDDQALWINTPQGLVIILGCCHAGVVNTIEYIRHLAGESRVAGIIGGLHLLHVSPERIEQTLIYLKKLKPDFIYAGHCTGDDVIVTMHENLRDSAVSQLYAGMHIGTVNRLLCS